MNLNMYGNQPLPIVNTQFSPPEPQQQHQQSHQPQHQPQQFSRPAQQDYAADISPTCLPVESIEGPPPMEPLGPQMSMHPGYDMHSDMHMLRPIPETNRPHFANGADAVMQSLMAAAAGSYMHPNAPQMSSHDVPYSYDHTGLPLSFSNDPNFPLPSTLPNDMGPTSDLYGNGIGAFSNFDYTTLNSNATVSTAPPNESTGSSSSEPSPYSAAQSISTAQSTGPTAMSSVPSVTSVASQYQNWTDDQNSSSDLTPANQSDDPFDGVYGNLPQAANSEHMLSLWSAGQPFQHNFYQQNNTSSQGVLSSPEQNDSKISLNADLEPPPQFSEDIYARRNSSTTALNEAFDSVGIQSRQPSTDGFKQPAQPSTIASRRSRRPAALQPSTIRSASYSAGMPASPGAGQTSADHTLRRIRSTGVTNGRIQKAPGSAQRSPLNFTFAEAAASPKFARTASSFASTVGPSGSLAPPTPQTPQDMVRFPYWQSNTVIRSHQPAQEHNTPESLNINWSAEPPSAGIYSGGGSPPSTPLDPSYLNQSRFNNNPLYRDTPPQSAPATQQCFPRSIMPPPQMSNEFHSTNDLTLMHPKPAHFRRPSLPDTSHAYLENPQIQFPVQSGHPGDLQNNYNYQFNKENMNGDYKEYMPGASHDNQQGQSSASDFYVHEYSPPQPVDPTKLPRRQQLDSQPKNYIFANQGPRDFR